MTAENAMKHPHTIALLLCTVLMAASAAMADTVPPDPAVKQIIEELELQRAPDAMRDHPAWNPRRVVISLPPGMEQRMPGLREQLETYAAGVELVYDTSPDMAPSVELLAEADAYIGLCTPQTLANASPRLLWLHSYTAGVDRCTDLDPALTRGRVFTNSKRLMGPAIAEHSIAMLLSLATNLPAYERAQAEHRWDRSLSARRTFGELRGKTLLVVGLGGIGTEIAWRANSLGMEVLATRNSSREGPDFVEYVGLPDELPTLAGQADAIVNALPLTAETTGIFNRAFFDRLKPGTIFISVGRGASTVTADLVAALESGKLFAAGLDVTDPEPLPADSPLWGMDNVIITPHVAAAGADSSRRVAAVAAENLRRYVEGAHLLNLVDMQAGY
jgi:phosphoglycerate dehydrogenase-like enzyme